MRYAAKIDANQPDIVKGLRSLGCVVWSTAGVGKGFPDIVVGHGGRNYLFEIKDPGKEPSRRRLTEREGEFFTLWADKGQVNVILTVEDAREIMGI